MKPRRTGRQRPEVDFAVRRRVNLNRALLQHFTALSFGRIFRRTCARRSPGTRARLCTPDLLATNNTASTRLGIGRPRRWRRRQLHLPSSACANTAGISRV
ncbi:hypothetical protein J4732_18950 [Serratia marcescens]|uniref:Uncharacterized protein n=1 Tax=Serratia marcescens TaxID=615 RepID=A0A939NTB6_SERMA|nr:hypothetical protein [Serratia marcescens]